MEYSSTSYLLHYGTIAFAVALNSVSVGIGEGMTSLAALNALTLQPSAENEISKTFILGMALVETAAVIGLTIALMLLSPLQNVENLAYIHYAEIGIAFAICLSGGIIGIASSFPAQYACRSVARQPFFAQKIQGLMLLTQSLMQTPIIFAFIVALFIKNQMHIAVTMGGSLRLMGSGLCIGLGSIGPSIGLALFSKQVCESVSINRKAYQQLLSFTLISEALIESPLIFALLVSLLLLQVRAQEPMIVSSITLFASALCMGLATLGPGISSGRIAAKACQRIALEPSYYGSLAKTSLFGQVMIETGAIYGLIVSFALIFSR